MIGLGTNRLSASRLAGLGEARQFRNGQWLEGVGSWFSPYSAAATAALKAAFPAQWAIIRDYGWEHPEIVGYMNAYAVEDAKIAYSLVPTLGVLRYIHGGYTEQVSTGIVPTTTMVINAKFRMNSVTQYHPAFQQGYISEQAMTTRCIADNGATNRLIFGLCGKTGGGKGVTVTFDYNVSGKWMDIQMDDTQVKVNGTTYAFSGSDRGSANTNPIYLLGRGDSYGATDIDFQLFETIDGNSKHTFVPYKVGNTCYILDLVTGNKIAGSFTISETPS